MLIHRLDISLGANAKTATAADERVQNALAAQDGSTGREIRTRHQLHDLDKRRSGVTYQRNCGVDDFRQIMRRAVGRHADRDTGTAVDEQVRNTGGQHFRFVFTVIVIRAKVDGFLVDVFKQRRGDLRKPRFGVPLCRRRVTVHGTEVPLAIHKRIAHVERLRHADQRIVNGRIAVRMVLAHHFASNFGALAGGAVRLQAKLVHAPQNAAMHGFQTIANIGKRPAHDYAHRVIQVRTLHLVFDIDGNHVLGFARVGRRNRRCGNFGVSHL